MPTIVKPPGTTNVQVDVADLQALYVWCKSLSDPNGFIDQEANGFKQCVASSDTSCMSDWLKDPNLGPDVMKTKLTEIQSLLSELAKARKALAAQAAAQTPPQQGQTGAMQQGQTQPVMVTAPAAVGMAGGAFVLGGLIGAAIMSALKKKKRAPHASREAMEAPRRRAAAPVAKTPAREAEEEART